MLKSRKLDLGDIANPQKFFRGDYFEIIPGSGESKTQFEVIRENELLLKAPNTLVLTLTAPETYGIAEGQSVFCNNIAIGQIVKQHLNVDGVNLKWRLHQSIAILFMKTPSLSQPLILM